MKKWKPKLFPAVNEQVKQVVGPYRGEERCIKHLIPTPFCLLPLMYLIKMIV